MSEWTRYKEIFLTDEQKEHIDNYGANGHLKQDGREIHLVAQDDHKCTWGVSHAQGELLIIGTGYCYQGSPKTDFWDDLEALVEKAGAESVSNSYVDNEVIEMSTLWTAKERRSFIRSIERLTKKAIQAYRE